MAITIICIFLFFLYLISLNGIDDQQNYQLFMANSILDFNLTNYLNCLIKFNLRFINNYLGKFTKPTTEKDKMSTLITEKV